MTSSITSRPDDRLERVGDRRAPRRHLLGLRAGQVAEVLAADRVDRAEHQDPLVRAPFEHRFEPGREREHALAGAGAAAEADDADLRRRGGRRWRCAARPMRPRRSNIDWSVRTRWRRLSGCTRRQRRLRARVQRDAGVARQVARGLEVDDLLLVAARRSPSSTTSSSTNPVQPESVASSLRYSSASRPTTPALRRSGRSLVTTTTSRPSRPRLTATARMRWSLAGDGERRRQRRRAPGG